MTTRFRATDVCTFDHTLEYWPRLFDGAAEMAAKYAALKAALAQSGRDQAKALRDAAGHWPGCLRECQLVAPAVLDARGLAASRGASRAPAPRDAWRARGEAAICLWRDLHDLLKNQRDAPVLGRRRTAREALVALAERAAMEPPALAALLFDRPDAWHIGRGR
jgi:hypothetical protein